MFIETQAMDGHTPYGSSEDTPPPKEGATHSSPSDEEQDWSSEKSRVSVVVHNGSIREGVASPQVSSVYIPSQNVPGPTAEDSRITSYVTECQASHSRPFEANPTTVIEDRRAEMVAHLTTIERRLGDLAGQVPAAVIQATEIEID